MSKRDIWHFYECANHHCPARLNSGSGAVVHLRAPSTFGVSVLCPLCGYQMRHDGFVEATESGHLPVRP